MILRSKGSVLLNRYNLSPSLNGYSFETDNGFNYAVYFLQADYFFDEDNNVRDLFYHFGFSKDTEKKKEDPKVQNTITHILETYFENQSNNALIYLCDYSDKKEYARAELFFKWFKEAKLNHLVKEDLTITVPTEGKYNKDILLSVIYKANHPQKEAIREAFYEELPNNEEFLKS